MASAASGLKLPGNTARRRNTARSSSPRRAWLQSSAPWSDRWRAGSRRPAVNGASRSPSRSTIWRGEKWGTCAAASSIARGMPSSLRQISAMSDALAAAMTKSGRTAAARSQKSCTASDVSVTSAPGHRQRVDRMDLFAVQAQCLAAGGEHGDVRTAFEDLVDEGGARVDQVLAVVEDQKHLPCRQEVDQLAGGPSRPCSEGHAGEPDRRRHRPGHDLGIGHGREVGEEDAVGELLEQPGCRGDRQPCLAASTDPGQRDETVGLEPLADGGDVGLPADEAGPLPGQVVPHRQAAQWGKVGAQIRVAELVHAFGSGDVPQAVQPQVGADDLGRQTVQSVGGGLGAHDLVGVGGGTQTGAAVGRGPVVVALPQLDVPGVEGGAHAHGRAVRPRFAPQRPLQLDRGSRRAARIGEDRERGVALALAPDQHAPVIEHARLDEGLVALEDGSGDLGTLLPQARRAADIGHQQREHTDRQRPLPAHRSSSRHGDNPWAAR